MRRIAIAALKRLEIGKALMIQRSDFSIEDDIAGGQPGYRAHQIWEAKAKIIPALRIETDDAIAFVELSAPAIELDLVKPAKAGRRLVSLGRETGFDEGEATQHTTYVPDVFEVARGRQERLNGPRLHMQRLA
jgi:hypothetical protein